MFGNSSQANGQRKAKRLHENSFGGRLAVVTGAGSGIGAATAQALANHGVNLALLDLDPAAVERVADNCRQAGVNAESFPADVTSTDQLTAVSEQIVDGLGPIDIVINNAGVGMSARFDDMSEKDWEWIRGVNLDGVMNGTRIFGSQLLRAGSGQVVNLSSGLAYTMRATEPGYVTTKAAVLAFSRCLRADWGREGVGVSVICPGVIDTPIFANTRLLGDQATEKARKRGTKVFARGHAPEKVADAICDAIASDKAVVPVGWEARIGWHLNGLIPTAIETRLARISPV